MLNNRYTKLTSTRTMDRADEEIEENIMKKSNRSALVLGRSWLIGKNIAIVGAAITCAPVIIPPLFALSTLGLAFSFPFAIYLGGYMCTHKVMEALLPLPILKEDEIEFEFVQNEENWDKGEIFEEDEISKSDFANYTNEAREDVSPKSPYTAVVLGGYGESTKREYEPPNLCSEHLSIVELKAQGKDGNGLAAKGVREEGGEEEERVRVANGCVVAEDKELLEECRTEVNCSPDCCLDILDSN